MENSGAMGKEPSGKACQTKVALSTTKDVPGIAIL